MVLASQIMDYLKQQWLQPQISWDPLGFSRLLQELVAIFPVKLLYSLTFSSSASFLSYSDHVMRLEIRCQAYHDSPTLLWDGMAAFDP